MWKKDNHMTTGARTRTDEWRLFKSTSNIRSSLLYVVCVLCPRSKDIKDQVKYLCHFSNLETYIRFSLLYFAKWKTNEATPEKQTDFLLWASFNKTICKFTKKIGKTWKRIGLLGVRKRVTLQWYTHTLKLYKDIHTLNFCLDLENINTDQWVCQSAFDFPCAKLPLNLLLNIRSQGVRGL